MIYTVTLNPAVDKTVEIDNFSLDSVNRATSVRLDAGGKGINVSKVVSSLGGRSIAMGILGGASGRFIKDYLDSSGIDNDFIFISCETRTNLKVVDQCRKTNTDINEPGPYADESELERLKQRLLAQIGSDSIVVLSGSVPNNTAGDIYAQWIKAAKSVGAKTIIDADGELLKHAVEAGPYLVKPNIAELEKLFGTGVNSPVQAEKYARRLVDKYDIKVVAVSLGERGAVFVDKNRSVLAHGIKVDVKSTVGAGDSMVAALAYSISMGSGFEESIRLAMACSAANVTTSGTQPAERSMISRLESHVTFECLERK